MTQTLPDTATAALAHVRRPYPAYRNSGVEWLGEIPAHWEVKRLKHALVLNDGGVWGGDAIDNQGTVVLRSTDITVDGKWNITNPAIRLLSQDDIRSSHLQSGDLVITKSSGSELHLGKTALVTSEIEALNCCFSNFMQRLRPTMTIDPKYLSYLLNCSIGREQLNLFGSTTTGLANLNGKVIGSIFIAAPPLDEQRAIAAYLDRETAHLDALVAKKQRLIELLREKRAALISHAVTRGLDPTAPMKDSGMPWLGEIPAHWGITPLRRVVHTFVDYRGATPDKVKNGIPLITAKNIKNGVIDFKLSEEFINEEDYAAWMVRGFPEVGDVLVTTEAPLGEVAQINDERIALAQRVILLKVVKSLMSHAFLKNYLLSKAGASELWSKATGSTAVGIKASHLREVLVPVPTLNEQLAIVHLIERETTRIEVLAQSIKRQLEKLKEYRAALVAAAVTGKIDVRDGGEATA